MGQTLYNKLVVQTLVVWKLLVFMVVTLSGTAGAPFFNQADDVTLEFRMILVREALPLEPRPQ